MGRGGLIDLSFGSDLERHEIVFLDHKQPLIPINFNKRLILKCVNCSLQYNPHKIKSYNCRHTLLEESDQDQKRGYYLFIYLFNENASNG